MGPGYGPGSSQRQPVCRRSRRTLPSTPPACASRQPRPGGNRHAVTRGERIRHPRRARAPRWAIRCAVLIPRCSRSEIAEADGPPARVRLLGEDLFAFRDTEGRIGLIDELCPHRRASLYFGRNEECGLRCIYHGWKFDVAGTCIDMMNEPEEYDFKHKVRVTAYPTANWAASSGPISARRKDAAAAEVRLDAGAGSQSPCHQGGRGVQLATGLEGGIDTSHAPILHRLLSETVRSAAGSSRPIRSCAARRRSWSSISPTTATSMPASARWAASEMHIRTYHFVMPFHQIRPSKSESGLDAGCRAHLGADR